MKWSSWRRMLIWQSLLSFLIWMMIQLQVPLRLLLALNLRGSNTEANDGSDEELNADYEIADDIDEGDNSDENEEDND
jgi:hypothetical protein